MERYKVLIDGTIYDADNKEQLLIDYADRLYHAQETIEVIGFPRSEGELPSYVGYGHARVDQCPYTLERNGYGYIARYHFLSYAAKEAAQDGHVAWIVDGTPQMGWPSISQLKTYIDPWGTTHPKSIEFLTTGDPRDYVAWVSAPDAYHQFVYRYEGLVTYEYKIISREAVALLRNVLNGK